MSIGQNITTLPDTKQGFTSNKSGTSLIKGFFLTTDDLVFSTLEDLQDIEVFFTEMESETLTPFHSIISFDPRNKEVGYTESLQYETYEITPGKKRHQIKFDWNTDFYDLVKQISGGKGRVIYYDHSNNLHLISEDGVNYKGFKTSRIVLEDLLFPTPTDPGLSIMDIELDNMNSSLNERREVVSVGWSPEDVDRLFVSVDINYVSSTEINFSVTHAGEPIIDLSSSDVTLIDDLNGTITSVLLNYTGGYYRATDITPNLTKGCLIVQATVYIGQDKYRVNAVASVINNFIYENGDNKIYENGDNRILEN